MIIIISDVEAHTFLTRCLVMAKVNDFIYNGMKYFIDLNLYANIR